MVAAGELNAAVGEEGVERYVAMTCQTDDPEREAAYLAFVRDIEPKLKPIQNAIREPLPRFAVSIGAVAETAISSSIVRSRTAASLFREANIPRETQLAELEQQYQKTIGAMTVTFRDQERTLAQMAPFLEETDRAVREEAWELAANRRLQDREALDDVVRPDETAPHRDRRRSRIRQFRRVRVPQSRTIRLRHCRLGSISRSRRTRRRPPDAARSRRSTGACSEWKRSDRGTRRSTRWAGRHSCRSKTSNSSPREPSRSFAMWTPSWASSFRSFVREQLLDLANRKGKAPGGYQTTFEDMRLPFIFMNAVGLDWDVRTLLHEGGHAFHTLACRGEPLSAYRESPLEFCEVASMTMELLGARRLDPFYEPAEADRSNRKLLEGIVLILPWIATVDAFQHWIYTHPDHTRLRTDRRLARVARSLRRNRRLVRPRRSPRPSVASPAPHFLVSFLLHRIRYRPARGLADLAAIPGRPAGGRRRLQESAGAGRLAAASRAVRCGRSTV